MREILVAVLGSDYLEQFLQVSAQLFSRSAALKVGKEDVVIDITTDINTSHAVIFTFSFHSIPSFNRVAGYCHKVIEARGSVSAVPVIFVGLSNLSECPDKTVVLENVTNVAKSIEAPLFEVFLDNTSDYQIITKIYETVARKCMNWTPTDKKDKKSLFGWIGKKTEEPKKATKEKSEKKKKQKKDAVKKVKEEPMKYSHSTENLTFSPSRSGSPKSAVSPLMNSKLSSYSDGSIGMKHAQKSAGPYIQEKEEERKTEKYEKKEIKKECEKYEKTESKKECASKSEKYTKNSSAEQIERFIVREEEEEEEEEKEKLSEETNLEAITPKENEEEENEKEKEKEEEIKEEQKSAEEKQIQDILESKKEEEKLLSTAPEQTLTTMDQLQVSQTEMNLKIENLHKLQEEIVEKLSSLSSIEEKEREKLESRLKIVEEQEKEVVIMREIKIAKYPPNYFRFISTIYIFF